MNKQLYMIQYLGRVFFVWETEDNIESWTEDMRSYPDIDEDLRVTVVGLMTLEEIEGLYLEPMM